MLVTGIDKFAEDIAFAFFIGAAFDAVFRVFAGPKAETIMMLGREDEFVEPTGFGGQDPLFGIKSSRIKQHRTLIAIAPFFSRKCVDGKMNKSDGLHPLIGHLCRSGDDLHRLEVLSDGSQGR